MFDKLNKCAFKISKFEIKYWMIIISVIAVYYVYHMRAEQSGNPISSEQFAEQNTRNQQSNENSETPILLVAMAPWCGYTKRFMGLENKNEGSKSFNINGGGYSNQCGGKTLADWQIIRGIFNNSSQLKIVEVDFDNSRDNPKYQEEIMNLVGDMSLEGFPTIYIKIGKKYHKYSGKRNVDNILMWIKDKTGVDHSSHAINYFSSNC